MISLINFTKLILKIVMQSLKILNPKHSYPPNEFTLFSQQYSPWTNYLEANAFTWNFDMLKFRDLTQGQHVLEFGKAMFNKFGFLKTLNCDPKTAISFLKDVHDSYLPNPYHNSMHGADVANACSYFITKIDQHKSFSELEVCCLLTSALVHDLGHPGVNNPFMVATKSREAMICKNVLQEKLIVR